MEKTERFSWESKIVETGCARCSASLRAATGGTKDLEAQEEILRTAACSLTYWQSDQTVVMAPSHCQIYDIVKPGRPL